MSKLPDDICRCHDSECKFKNNCLRYLLRLKGAGDYMVHASSLAVKGLCNSRIEPKPQDI